MRQQFQLVYYGSFSYEDTQGMAVFERRYFHDLLATQKQEEKSAREQAVEEARRKQSSSNNKKGTSRSPNRRSRR